MLKNSYYPDLTKAHRKRYVLLRLMNMETFISEFLTHLTSVKAEEHFRLALVHLRQGLDIIRSM